MGGDEERTEHERANDRARERAASSSTGIGVAYIGEVTEPGTDGWRGAVAVSDGEQTAQILVAAAGHNGYRGMPINSELLEALVELHVGSFRETLA